MIRLVVPEVGAKEIEAVSEVLSSGYLVQGKMVAEFEERVREYLGSDYAVAVSSGTAALHTGLLALGIGAGDEVIVPDFTFPATANAVALTGAVPVFADIDLETYNIDAEKISALITKRTRAIMPVHLFGLSARIDEISDIAEKNGLFVIEDAACAIGAEYKHKKCGTFGNLGIFSFHPRKIITTGEGGMIVTDDKDIALKARRLRNHGIDNSNGKIRFETAGFNYRLTDFQAALGISQMKRLDNIIGQRIELAEFYENSLKEIKEIKLPVTLKDSLHIYQSYVILLDENISRDSLMKDLFAKGIETSIGTYALSLQPYYFREGFKLPNSSCAYQQSLALPLHSRMNAGDIEKVSILLKESVGRMY